MAAMTHLCTIDHVAEMSGEDVALLKAIIANDDNLTYGNIASVHASPHQAITAPTDDRIEEPTDRIQAARITTKTWHEFLDDFGDNPDLVSQIKAQPPR